MNSIVHHTMRTDPLSGSISWLDVGCTLTLMMLLCYVGFQSVGLQGAKGPRRLWAAGGWALALWCFAIFASLSVMWLVNPLSINSGELAAALLATVVLAPMAIGLGILGAWIAARGYVYE